MMKLRLGRGRASFADAAAELGVAESELDAEFGIVELDPDMGVYAVMVDERTAEAVKGRPGVEGPFADPPIGPAGES
jgi:hypothetical protein